MGTVVSESSVPYVGCKLASPASGDWAVSPTQRRGDGDGDEQVPSRLWTPLGGFHARQWQRCTPAFRVELMKRSNIHSPLPLSPTASAAAYTTINKNKNVINIIMNHGYPTRRIITIDCPQSFSTRALWGTTPRLC